MIANTIAAVVSRRCLFSAARCSRTRVRNSWVTPGFTAVAPRLRMLECWAYAAACQRPTVLLRHPPHPVERLVARRHLFQRVGVVQSTVLHHVAERVGVADVLQRIAIEHLKIGELSNLQRPQVTGHADRL